METSGSSDVVIVGGGIGGSALALVLARHGVGMTVLERQLEYADRVCGEYMQAWGSVEARRLELLDLLYEAGGFHPKRSTPYDETIPPDRAEMAVRDTSTYLPGMPGPLWVGHPAACRVLSAAAEAAGARYARGVSQVAVTAGARPTVEFARGNQVQRHDCRLVVGADGRRPCAVRLDSSWSGPTRSISCRGCWSTA
jgi:menaquinone-9 beta-reductase